MTPRQKQAAKKTYDYSGLEVGARVKAESDGTYYSADVIAVSTSKNRTKAPVKVRYFGYEGYDEWLGGDRLRSKALKVVEPEKETEGEIPIGMAIFVNGFDFDTSESAIEEHFGAIGKVSSIKLVRRGAAIVRFEDPDAATKAVHEMDETTIPGNSRYINVKIDGEKGSKGGKKGGGKDYDYGDSDEGGKECITRDLTTYDGEFQTGTVALFVTGRGFGYITPDEGENDIFVHYTAIRGSGFRKLAEGQRVSFGAEADPTGKGKGSVIAVAVSII